MNELRGIQKARDYLKKTCVQDRVPPSILMVGPECSVMQGLIEEWMAFMDHPHVSWIKPEGKNKSLQVDQIRAIQESVFLRPRHTDKQFFVIESMRPMNRSVGNALLKILEEPPSFTHLIVLSSSLSAVLPTIASRCHKLTIDPQVSHDMEDLDDTQRTVFFEGIVALCRGDTCPAQLAGDLKSWDLQELIRLFYLLTAQCVYCITKNTQPIGVHQDVIKAMLSSLSLRECFRQYDLLSTMKQKLDHNININHILVIERILTGLVKGVKVDGR